MPCPVPSLLLSTQADAKVFIKEAMDALASKDDKVISAYIKRKCDERYGPTVSRLQHARACLPSFGAPLPHPTLTRPSPVPVPPQWHCIVGEDFKAAIAHESKHFIFVTMGKTNILLYKHG